MGNPISELRGVTSIWDHTMLLAIRHKQTHPAPLCFIFACSAVLAEKCILAMKWWYNKLFMVS